MLRLYSNPEVVKEKARKYRLNPVYESTRRNKKYMVYSNDGKWVHFGQIPFEDYTKHHDKTRLEAFRRRNWRWEHAPVYSPRWLSWYLLW